MITSRLPRQPYRAGRSAMLVLTAVALSALIWSCTDDGPGISEPRVGQIEISPGTVVLAVGASRTLAVTIKDASGRVLSGEAVRWESTDETVVTVTVAGTVTAEPYTGADTREAHVVASAGSAVDSARVEVTPSAVERVELVSPDAALVPWETARLSAVPYDAEGNELTGRAIIWSAEDPSVVDVDESGNATAYFLGSAEIAAAVDDAADTVTVTVATPTPVWVSPNIDVAPDIWAAETSVAINPRDPLNVVASANQFHFSSFDGGRTWSHAWIPGGELPQVDPNVAFLPDGTLLRQGLALEPGIARPIVVQRSLDGGRTLPSELAVTAYLPPGTEAGMDQGIMAVDDAVASPYRGNAYVIGSDYLSEEPPYERTGFSLLVLRSEDGGTTWSQPLDISDPPNGGQEADSFIATGPAGAVYAAWLATLNCFVYFDRSLDGGVTWEEDVHVHTCEYADEEHPTSDDVRGNPTIAVDLSDGPYGGTIYLSATDSKAPSGAADSWVRTSVDGGKTWSAPVYFSDGPKGAFNYYFQPRISVAPNGRLDVVWYDTRHWGGDDINELIYDVYYTYSTDGGSSFSPAIRVSSSSALKRTTCPTNQACGQRHLYEYLGLASDESRAVMAWTDVRSEGSRVNYAVVWHADSDGSAYAR